MRKGAQAYSFYKENENWKEKETTETIHMRKTEREREGVVEGKTSR